MKPSFCPDLNLFYLFWTKINKKSPICFITHWLFWRCYTFTGQDVTYCIYWMKEQGVYQAQLWSTSASTTLYTYTLNYCYSILGLDPMNTQSIQNEHFPLRLHTITVSGHQNKTFIKCLLKYRSYTHTFFVYPCVRVKQSIWETRMSSPQFVNTSIVVMAMAHYWVIYIVHKISSVRKVRNFFCGIWSIVDVDFNATYRSDMLVWAF